MQCKNKAEIQLKYINTVILKIGTSFSYGTLFGAYKYCADVVILFTVANYIVYDKKNENFKTCSQIVDVLSALKIQ